MDHDHCCRRRCDTRSSEIGGFNQALSYYYLTYNTNITPAFPDTHGTRVVSLAVGQRNNNLCTLGAAPQATFAVLRIYRDSFGGNMANNTGLALVFTGLDRHLSTDVLTASLGSNDDGMTLNAEPGVVTRHIEMAKTIGRNSPGLVIVRSAGNGGSGDDCDCDGYVINPYLLPVQGLDNSGLANSFNENCAAAFTSVFVDNGFPVTNSHQAAGTPCSTYFGGTSAAAAVVDGAVLLVVR